MTVVINPEKIDTGRSWSAETVQNLISADLRDNTSLASRMLCVGYVVNTSHYPVSRYKA